MKHSRRKCAYYFRYHTIRLDANSGSCKCGSKLDVHLERDEENVVHFKCTGTEGDGACGKLFLRNKERKIVAAKLLKKPVYVYRAEEANHQMKEGDSEPQLFSRLLF